MTMTLPSLPNIPQLPHFVISWVDFITALVLFIGFVHGRKRGFSEELLDTLQWLAIIVVGSCFYRQLGELLNQTPFLSPLTYYILSYVIIALVLKLMFSVAKRSFGQKLIDSDVFGRGEFYLGMVAGMTRWACMLLFLLSLLHAPAFSAEFRAKKAKEDSYNYGDITFPSIMSIQDEVYKVSITGKCTEKYLSVVLMSPLGGGGSSLRDENTIAKRREREVDLIMRGR